MSVIKNEEPGAQDPPEFPHRLFHAEGAEYMEVVSPEVSVADAAEINDSAPSDYEYDSHYSSGESDWPETDDEKPTIADRHVIDDVDMGEAIAYAFPAEMKYDTDDVGGFEEDVSDKEEGNESEGSENYEELSDGEGATRMIVVHDSQEDTKMSGGISESEGDDGDESYESDDSENDSGKEVEEGPSTIPTIIPEISQAPDAAHVPKSLNEIQKADVALKKQEQIRDQHLWAIKALRETLRNAEVQLREAETHLASAEDDLSNHTQAQSASLASGAISSELFQAYQDFGESLYPEFGLRDGFEVVCDEPHGGSYVVYDPDFEVFKKCVETDWRLCNWRCEAFGEKVVQFWPVRCPEPVTGVETTWGEQFPELYDLAATAARQGSAAALTILLRLPDMNAGLGGWLFQYSFEILMKEELVVSRRWNFGSAHSIGNPLPREEKRQRLVLWLQSTA